MNYMCILDIVYPGQLRSFGEREVYVQAGYCADHNIFAC